MEQARAHALNDKLIEHAIRTISDWPYERRVYALRVPYLIYESAMNAALRLELPKARPLLEIMTAAVVLAAEMMDVARRYGAQLVFDDLPTSFIAQVQKRMQSYSPTVTTEEAGALLGCTDRHVRRLAGRSLIAARRLPTGAWLCQTRSVFAYRERNQVRKVT